MAASPSEFCHASLGWTYGQALAVTCALVLGCGLWLYAVGQRAAPGRWRLAAAAPVLVVNAVLPKLFCRWDDITTIVLIR